MLIKIVGKHCKHCKVMEAILNELNIIPDEAYILEDNLDIACKYNVSTMPSLIKVQDNSYKVLLGLHSKEEIEKFCKE